MKELAESRTWLRIVASSGNIEREKMSSIIEESSELSRILSASVITMRAKIKAKEAVKG